MKSISIITVLILLVASLFFSCTRPILASTKTYEIDVQLEKQVELTFCVPTSVLMCAEYFAKDVGWVDPAFDSFDSASKEKFIYDKLMEYGGTTFYPNSLDGAPKSISKFLFNYLNISNRLMALLHTSAFCEETMGSLELVMEEIRDNKKPLISITNETTTEQTKTHAVVITGFQEELKTGNLSKVFYADPWFGYRNKTKSEWQRYSYLSSGQYLTMYFGDYY